MQSKNEHAPRLHVLLARRAPLGLVIRRGPSKQVSTFLWDRTNDFFKLGQWMKGRIYERRSDLSPDWRHIIYFAMNGKWESEVKGSWTAISRAPYLKALAIYPKGDCWHGGGLWIDDQTYWLRDALEEGTFRESADLRRDLTFEPPNNYGNAECLGVYYPRLLRDGWSLNRSKQTSESWHATEIFDKPIGAGWILRKTAHAQINAPVGKGCYWDEHELVHPPSGETMAFPNWEWADLDGSRVVWAADGKLNGADVSTAGLQNQRQLFDFNEMTFRAIRAPY